MTFHPKDYLGRPVPNLLSVLEHLDPAELVGEEYVELHSPLAGEAALECRPTTLMNTTLPAANLPGDHPEVAVPGVVLEDYLGGGGQGWVYVGRVTSTNHVVAVKVLRASYVKAQGTASREAALCARVRHRNILRVFDTQEAGAFWVVIMELVQGEEFQRGALPEQHLQRCFGQLADALHALAEKQIVHCDIKPGNILLRQNDHSPVLVDFGIARDLADPQPAQGLSGTPYYMAPETFENSPPDPAWDAYSLGVTASVLLAGKQNGYKSLSELHTAKTSGTFDKALRKAVEQIANEQMRSWVQQLISTEKAKRLAAVETARQWRLAG